MNTKKEIEGLLITLKKHGFDRARIEKDLEYSENYIDQTLSKGGNRRFLSALRGYANRMLQKATSKAYVVAEDNQGAIANEPIAEYKKPIKIQTATGKTIAIFIEGTTDIELLNAFLEERDRVINTLKDEKQARIEELLKDKDQLYKLLNSSLGDISKVQQAIFAMVRSLQEHEAVIASSGSKKREVEMLNTLSKLNGDNVKLDAKQDSSLVLNK